MTSRDFVWFCVATVWVVILLSELQRISDALEALAGLK